MHPRDGFTLIELSIVLVIIGFIIGGVLVGRDLIAAAKVRAQISQFDKYQAAVNTFRLKYNYLPGDIPEPYATNYGFTTRGTAQYKGDGNGMIDGGCVFATRYGCETALFWKDLRDAGLIDANVSNITYTGSHQNIAATVGMEGYLPLAAIGERNFIAVLAGNGNGYHIIGFNYFYLGQITATVGSGDYSASSGISPLQANVIDTKMDDGQPGTGTLRAAYAGGGVAFDSFASDRCGTSATQYNIGGNYANQTVCQLSLRMR